MYELYLSHYFFFPDFKSDIFIMQLMSNYVGNGGELMPHRSHANVSNSSQPEQPSQPIQPTKERQTTARAPAPTPTTPIRKFTRNRGLVLHDQAVLEESPDSEISVVEDSPVYGDDEQRAAALRKGKRKLR